MSDQKPLFPPVPYAFPFDVQCTGSRDLSPGMTLRDYFAGQALAGMLADSTVGGEVDDDPDRLAHAAYQYANSMMKAREG